MPRRQLRCGAAALGVIAAVLVFASGCAQKDWIDRTLVTVDVSGVWTGSLATLDGQPMVSLDIRLDLQQKAAKVTGYFLTGRYLSTNPRGATNIEGSVANDVLTFEVARLLIGELTIDGEEMKGSGLFQTPSGGSRPVTITLRRVEVPTPTGSQPR